MKYEKHHVIPLGLKGSNEDYNICSVDTKTHKEIHKVLNAGSKSIRHFRQQSNDVIIPNMKSIEEKHKLRRRYFQNINNLSEKGVYCHAKNFAKHIAWKDRANCNLAQKLGVGRDDVEKEYKIYNIKNKTYKEIVQETQEKLHKLLELDKEYVLGSIDLFLQQSHEK